jgi:hypothetical protein
MTGNHPIGISMPNLLLGLETKEIVLPEVFVLGLLHAGRD